MQEFEIVARDELLALRQSVPRRYQYRAHGKPAAQKTKLARRRNKAGKGIDDESKTDSRPRSPCVRLCVFRDVRTAAGGVTWIDGRLRLRSRMVS